MIGDGTTIGPFSYIGPNVRIGERNRIHSHVTIEGPSEIGNDNAFFPGSAIGTAPQDLKYAGEPTTLKIGDRNLFRECVTVNRGTKGGGGHTEIGSDCLFMAYAHVAHDCMLGNSIIMANCATLAGHVHIGDFVTIGGLTPIQQFVRIGPHAFIGGATRVAQDIVPYIKMGGIPPIVMGTNSIGLSRRGMPDEMIKEIERAIRILFKSGLNTTQALEAIKKELTLANGVKTIVDFVESAQRGIFK